MADPVTIEWLLEGDAAVRCRCCVTRSTRGTTWSPTRGAQLVDTNIYRY